MSENLPDVIAATPLAEYKLHLCFDDGVEGDVDISKIVPFDGVFAPLRELAVFRSVTVNPELGTIVWPGGADIDPLVLHSTITGEPIRWAQEVEPVSRQ